jgi:hypothetical protein
MRRGLDLILSRLREQPSPILAHRYLALVAELADEKEKFDRTLDLAEHLTESRPKEALRLALVAHRAYRHELRPLDIMIAVMEQRGKGERVRLLRAERDKLRKELEKNRKNPKGFDHPPGPAERAFDKKRLEVTFSSTRVPMGNLKSAGNEDSFQGESKLLEAAVMDLWDNESGEMTHHSHMILPTEPKKNRPENAENIGATQKIPPQASPFPPLEQRPQKSPPGPPAHPGALGNRPTGSEGDQDYGSPQKNVKKSPQIPPPISHPSPKYRVYPGVRSSREQQQKTILSPKLVQGLEGKRPGDTILGIRVNSKPPIRRQPPPKPTPRGSQKNYQPSEQDTRNSRASSHSASSSQISISGTTGSNNGLEPRLDKKTIPQIEYQRSKGSGESLPQIGGARDLQLFDDGLTISLSREKSQPVVPLEPQAALELLELDVAHQVPPKAIQEIPQQVPSVASGTKLRENLPDWDDGERTVVSQLSLEYRHDQTMRQTPQPGVALRIHAIGSPASGEVSRAENHLAEPQSGVMEPPHSEVLASSSDQQSAPGEVLSEVRPIQEDPIKSSQENQEEISASSNESGPTRPPRPLHLPLQAFDETRLVSFLIQGQELLPQGSSDQKIQETVEKKEDSPKDQEPGLPNPQVSEMIMVPLLTHGAEQAVMTLPPQVEELEKEVLATSLDDSQKAKITVNSSQEFSSELDFQEPTIIDSAEFSGTKTEIIPYPMDLHFGDEVPTEILAPNHREEKDWEGDSLNPSYISSPTPLASDRLISGDLAEELDPVPFEPYRLRASLSDQEPILTPENPAEVRIQSHDVGVMGDTGESRDSKSFEGIKLPRKLVDIMIAQIRASDAERKQGIIWSLLEGLWGEHPQEDTVYIMEQCSLTHFSLSFWGFYLRALMATGDFRRALQEVRFTLKLNPKLSWAMVAYEHLDEIWAGLGVKGFQWEPEWGIQSLMDLLNRVPKPSLASLVSSEGYEIVDDSAFF